MHALKKNNATNIRHAPPISGCGSRTRRAANGLQVPRHPTLLARKCTTLERICRNQACNLTISTAWNVPAPECVSALGTTSYACRTPFLVGSRE
jgi:hypothetical protein